LINLTFEKSIMVLSAKLVMTKFGIKIKY